MKSWRGRCGIVKASTICCQVELFASFDLKQGQFPSCQSSHTLKILFELFPFETSKRTTAIDSQYDFHRGEMFFILKLNIEILPGRRNLMRRMHQRFDPQVGNTCGIGFFCSELRMVARSWWWSKRHWSCTRCLFGRIRLLSHRAVRVKEWIGRGHLC